MIFDSCVLIDGLNGHEYAIWLMYSDSARAISVMSPSEVLAGAFLSDAQRVAFKLFDRFTTFVVTPAIADLAGTIRRDRTLKLADAIILATSQTSGLALVTRDARLARVAGTAPAYNFA